MKKIFILLTSCILAGQLYGQVNDYFNYQAVIRDANGAYKSNTNVNVVTDILQGSSSGNVVFTELHAVTTNEFGLVNLKIGSIDPTGFALIDWSNGPYFLRITVDGTEMGTSQLLSVPYALYAKRAGSFTEADPIFSAHPSSGISTGDIQNWNTAYSWGDHAGLYKPITYVPDWSDLTNNPIHISAPMNNQLLRYDSIAGKWENWTPDFLTSEVDGSVTNEIQTLGLSGTTLTISGTGGNSVDFTNWDTDKSDDVTLAAPVTGDMVYYNGSSWTAIPKGTAGQVLTLNTSGVPEWKNAFTVPPAITLPATFNLPTVIFNGQVSPNNLPTTVTFQYGTTTGYGSTVTATQSPVDGSATVNVSSNVNGLVAGTTYHYRIVTTNSLGTSYGDDVTFTLLGIGVSWQGGIIFYLDSSGQHGLVAASSDQGTGEWGCYQTLISGADGTAVGTGNQNTTDIITGCTTTGIAAEVCYNLSLNTFNDWFLPSRDELNLMYSNLYLAGKGSFNAVNYWSSSEYNADNAYKINFGTGSVGTNYKNTSYLFRAVRAF